MYASEDCEEPLKLWLEVTGGCFALHCLFLFISEALSAKFKDKVGITSIYITVNTVFQCFLFLWMLAGEVWAFNDSDCRDEFYEGWTLSVTILGLYFGILSLFLLGLCFIITITCVGSWQISNYLSKNS